MTSAIEIVHVDRLDCRYRQTPWAFEDARAEEIDAFWAARVAANPALYDGLVMLASRAQIETAADGARVFRADFFKTRFSRFLFWRDRGAPDASAHNCFSMPALVSRDGAYLVGEMGAGHSCEGRLYFPAGTPDCSDLVGDIVDLEGSILRELAEEAGIVAHKEQFRDGWTLIFENRRIACMKIIDWPETAATLLERVSAYIAAEEKPELAAAHMIGQRAQLRDPRLQPFMTAFLEGVLAD